MLRPIRLITITDPNTGRFIQLTRVNTCVIESSWKTLTDTAKIVLPRNIKAVSGNINDILKRGSKVVIEFGQIKDGNPILRTEFTGYISRVNAQTPVTVECEDEMWQLKQTNFTKTFGKFKLVDLIKYIYKGKVNVIDIELPSYRISNASGAKVLESLQEQYHITSYLKNGILNVGFAYDFASKNTVIYFLERNVPTDGNKLVFHLPTDMKLFVKATSIQPGGKTLSYQLGDLGGVERYFKPGYGASAKTLIHIVTEVYKKYQVGGLTGSLETFGYVFCQHGDIAQIISREYPDREGFYFIDKVTTSNDINGFVRIIEPGRRSNL